MKWTTATTTSTGNVADLDFSGADLLRCNNSSLMTLQGLSAGVDGQRLAIVSVGAGQVDLSHQDTGDSTAANRLICFATTGKTSLAAGVGTSMLQYDGSAARWRLVAHEQGAPITVPYNGADFTASGSMTWTVDSGDLLGYTYYLRGRELRIGLIVDTSSIGGTVITEVWLKLPLTFAAGSYTSLGWAAGQQGTTEFSSSYYALVGETKARIRCTPNGSNFVLSTNSTVVYASGIVTVA